MLPLLASGMSIRKGCWLGDLLNLKRAFKGVFCPTYLAIYPELNVFNRGEAEISPAMRLMRLPASYVSNNVIKTPSPSESEDV